MRTITALQTNSAFLNTFPQEPIFHEFLKTEGREPPLALAEVMRTSGLRLVCPLFPMRPAFALASF
jgi:hypothetical protein